MSSDKHRKPLAVRVLNSKSIRFFQPVTYSPCEKTPHKLKRESESNVNRELAKCVAKDSLAHRYLGRKKYVKKKKKHCDIAFLVLVFF